MPPVPITVGTMLRIFSPARGPSPATSAGWLPDPLGPVGDDGLRAVTLLEGPGCADEPAAGPWLDAAGVGVGVTPCDAVGVGEDTGVGVGGGADVGRGVGVGVGAGVGVGVGAGSAPQAGDCAM